MSTVGIVLVPCPFADALNVTNKLYVWRKTQVKIIHDAAAINPPGSMG
jgi:hypothetical protein